MFVSLMIKQLWGELLFKKCCLVGTALWNMDSQGTVVKGIRCHWCSALLCLWSGLNLTHLRNFLSTVTFEKIPESTDPFGYIYVSKSTGIGRFLTTFDLKSYFYNWSPIPSGSLQEKKNAEQPLTYSAFKITPCNLINSFKDFSPTSHPPPLLASSRLVSFRFSYTASSPKSFV